MTVNKDTGAYLEELIAEITNCAGTILIVDDQAEILEMLSALLVSEGYQVLLAEDGQEAVEKYERHRGDIGLVLMDITMPRKDGVHAYKEIKEIDPAAKVILMTGYDAGHLNEFNDVKIPLPECVLKPFSSINLLETISKYFDKSQVP
jgi:CheY-like chemotaxis protein